MSYDPSTKDDDIDLEGDLNYDDKWQPSGRLIIGMPSFIPNIFRFPNCWSAFVRIATNRIFYIRGLIMNMLQIKFDNDVFTCIQKDKFAILTLKKNALNITKSVSAKEELFSALSAVEESTSVKGLILINSIQYPGDVEYKKLFEELMRSESYERNKHRVGKLKNMHSQILSIILNFEKPIVAGMHGIIEPFFLGVCFAAEFRFATPDTKLVRINTKLGLPPDGVVAFFLMQNLGQAKTIDIFLSKSSLSATEAYDLGLLTEIVPENELQNKCLEKLEKICELPSYAISATRRLIQPQFNILDDFIKRSYDDYWNNLMIMKRTSEIT